MVPVSTTSTLLLVGLWEGDKVFGEREWEITALSSNLLLSGFVDSSLDYMPNTVEVFVPCECDCRLRRSGLTIGFTDFFSHLFLLCQYLRSPLFNLKA